MKKDNDEERSLPYRCYLLLLLLLLWLARTTYYSVQFLLWPLKKKKFEKYSIAHPMNCNNGH